MPGQIACPFGGKGQAFLGGELVIKSANPMKNSGVCSKFAAFPARIARLSGFSRGYLFGVFLAYVAG
jgi:hypothetical protein